MIQIAISKDSLEALDQVLKDMGKRPKNEIRDAVNRAAKESMTLLYQKTFEEYAMKRSALRKSDLKLQRANLSSLKATISVSSDTLGLKKHYGTRKNGKRKAAQAQVKRSGSMTPLMIGGRKAFVTSVYNRGDSSHLGIFQRADSYMTNPYSKSSKRRKKNGQRIKRQKIRELFGPGSAKATEMVAQEQYETIGKMLLDEMTAAMTRIGEKA